MDHDQVLFQQLKGHTVSGEHLEMLGKKASADWCSGNYKTLTDAVVGTVKQASLSPEQVRRVVEFANTAAFLTEFRKEGAHHVVDFGHAGPADPGAVMHSLNTSAAGTELSKQASADYNTPPPDTNDVISDAAEVAFLEMFKTAGPTEFPEVNPYGDVIEMKDKLAAARDLFASQINSLEVDYAEATERMYQEIKQAALGGSTLGEAMQAWQTVTPSVEHVKVAFQTITPRLVREGVFHSASAIGDSLVKTGAERMVNSQHPLVSSFGEYCEVLNKLASVRTAQGEVDGALKELGTFLKQASIVDAVKGTHRAVSGGAKALAPHVAKHIGHPLAGDAVELIGNTAVPIAGLLAANEVRRKIKYNPAVQAGLSHVPYTQQYQQREQELAASQYGMPGGYY